MSIVRFAAFEKEEPFPMLFLAMTTPNRETSDAPLACDRHRGIGRTVDDSLYGQAIDGAGDRIAMWC